MTTPSPQSELADKGWFQRLVGRMWPAPEVLPEPVTEPERAPQVHVVLIDGTMSSLVPKCQTNVARSYELLREMGPAVRLYYAPGLQWRDWRSARDVLTGRGINAQIKRAYGHLASRYRAGDKIYLMGYSRGAYAVRSLAGVIERVGLLRQDSATERHVKTAYRHYECSESPEEVARFRAQHCHPQTPIEMIGVWDTVKSLGINAPVLWRISERWHAFHHHALSENVRHGFHALALNETRVAYKAIPWVTTPDRAGTVEQMWFAGTHSDIGGQLGGFEVARPLANIPLVWMLARAQSVGLALPDGWEGRYALDPTAPSRGTWRGYGRLLITRRKRIVGADPSEAIHPSVALRQAEVKPRWYRRRAQVGRA